MMRHMMRLVMASQLSEIRRASRLVDEFKARHGLADEDSDAIHIVLDEILSNSIRHGVAGEALHEIVVSLDLADGEIIVQVDDDGVAYDPTEAPTPSLAGSLEERNEGGLGVLFVRALTHAIEYRHIDGRNRLVLRRRIGQGARQNLGG
jgi:anti-sigma regulatory factor (Ser/Thr protein kinase)